MFTLFGQITFFGEISANIHPTSAEIVQPFDMNGVSRTKRKAREVLLQPTAYRVG